MELNWRVRTGCLGLTPAPSLARAGNTELNTCWPPVWRLTDTTGPLLAAAMNFRPRQQQCDRRPSAHQPNWPGRKSDSAFTGRSLIPKSVLARIETSGTRSIHSRHIHWSLCSLWTNTSRSLISYYNVSQRIILTVIPSRTKGNGGQRKSSSFLELKCSILSFKSFRSHDFMNMYSDWALHSAALRSFDQTSWRSIIHFTTGFRLSDP